MKHMKFLKSVFTQGMLTIILFLLVANFLMFKYIPTGTGAFWFILVEELAVVFGYITARSLGEPDTIIWWFAKKWWPEEETLKDK